MMVCKNCYRTFFEEERISVFSGSISDDEVTDVHYLYHACNQYTVAICWDKFTGDETMKVSGGSSCPWIQAV